MKTKFNGILTLLLALIVQISFAQEKTISGTVSDEAGPLPGVTILKKGTTQGTETNFDGNYSIKAKSGDILVFSFVGMKTIERTVGISNQINIKMESDNVLEEVVVTALGVKRKPKELTYSSASLKSKDITQTKAVNAATAMVGKVSGLQINTINNGVNPSTRVVLRGNRSILGNNEALIVVDGYPSSRGVLDRINPNDIVDITVIKGANGAAVYGSEGANGVIIITTKSGKGKLKITYDGSVQLESVAYLPEMQEEFGAGGFPDGTLYPLENVNWGPRYDGRLVDASETLDNGEVWQVPFTPIKDRNRKFFNTGITTRNGVTVSSGDADSDFLMSIDHNNTTGTVPKDKYDRTNFRLKASKKYNKFTFSGNFSFFRSHSDLVGEGGRQERPVYWNVINTPLHIPITEMKNWRDGKFTRNEVSYFRFYENPYFIIDTQREKTNYNEFTIIGEASYDFSESLKATLRAGYTSSSRVWKRKFGEYRYAFHLENTYYEMDEYGARTADDMQTSTRLNTDFILTYDTDLSDDFSLKTLLGSSVRINDFSRIGVSGDNLIIPDFYNVSVRTGELNGFQTSSRRRKIGIYSEATLGFKEYLYLTVTARNDWTSTLSKDNRSFFYPGAGISFIASDAFPGIVGSKGLSYLKTNLNITKSGNDPSEYQNSDIFSAPDNFPYANTTGLTQSSRIQNPNLKPEFTTSMDLGVEFGLFNNRITGSVSGYKTNTTDQILPIGAAPSSGATSYLTNLGEVENIGLEADLNIAVVRNDNWTWEVGANYSGYKSEVVSLADGVEEVSVGGYTGLAEIVAKVGEPYPLIKTTSYERDSQGRVIVDADGDPIQNSENLTHGKTTPDYILGFNTRLKYKNWSLYANMDYRTGHVFYNSLVDALEFTGLTQHSVTAGRQPFVFPNSSYSDGNGGYIANTDRLTSGGGNAFWDSYNEVKENYVTDASVLKIREVLLSYTFSPDVLKSFGVSSMQIGAFGRNLFTFRPDSNVYTDPEFNFTSGNTIGIGTQSQTPPTRQYGLNLSLTF